MALDTTDDLLHALRGSGLFTGEQLGAFARDLSPFGADLQAGMKHLIAGDRVTLYQLGKILRGKGADLVVGPYVVLDKLGEGGMGKVFRARHARLGRTVALKVMRAHLVKNPTIRGRYEREVQAISRLDHPNIVRVDTAGEANGKVYLAMEFVDGVDLARMMRDFRRLEVAEACEYARQAALGLQHAHERGLVHRDIKPSNIVVAGERHLPQAEELAVVKLLDLGLARAVDPDDMVSPDLTRDHTVVGTPDYMAPEQAKNSRLVGPRADLYSLGCTLYFLLTGRVPFPGGGAIEKMMQHQLDLAAPLQALRPGVPGAVAELVARLMAKRPDDRPADAAAVAAALEPHARYPRGAAPVPVVKHRSGPRTEPASGGSTFPPPGTGSSFESGLLFDNPSDPVPAPPVAPLDDTPRPRGSEAALAETKIDRDATRRYPSARRARAAADARTRRAVWWAVIALVGAALAALGLWAATLPTNPPQKAAPPAGPKAEPPRIGPKPK